MMDAMQGSNVLTANNSAIDSLLLLFLSDDRIESSSSGWIHLILSPPRALNSLPYGCLALFSPQQFPPSLVVSSMNIPIVDGII